MDARLTQIQVLGFVDLGAIAQKSDGGFIRFGFTDQAAQSRLWLRRVREVLAKGWAEPGPEHLAGATVLVLTAAGSTVLREHRPGG